MLYKASWIFHANPITLSHVRSRSIISIIKVSAHKDSLLSRRDNRVTTQPLITKRSISYQNWVLDTQKPKTVGLKLQKFTLCWLRLAELTSVRMGQTSYKRLINFFYRKYESVGARWHCRGQSGNLSHRKPDSKENRVFLYPDRSQKL